MSTTRKKNSTHPAGKKATFIKMHDDSPWEDDWYMCAMCGALCPYKDLMKHAADSHKAYRAELLDIQEGAMAGYEYQETL